MFIIESGKDSKVEVYLNDKGEVFFGDKENDYDTYFTITREEWGELKAFIDQQYKDLDE